jgi:hypothetical protein
MCVRLIVRNLRNHRVINIEVTNKQLTSPHVLIHMLKAFMDVTFYIQRVDEANGIKINITERIFDFINYLGNLNFDYEIETPTGELIIPDHGGIKIEIRKQEVKFEGYWQAIKNLFTKKRG